MEKEKMPRKAKGADAPKKTKKAADAKAEKLVKHLLDPAPKGKVEVKGHVRTKGAKPKTKTVRAPKDPNAGYNLEAKCDGEARRRGLTVRKAAQALTDSGGIISHAAEELEVSRQTLWLFVQRRQELKDLLHDLKESTMDLAESQLHMAMMGGDLDLCWKYLTRMGHSRGYTDRGAAMFEKMANAFDHMASMRNDAPVLKPDEPIPAAPVL